jgi:hypothetical protein
MKLSAHIETLKAAQGHALRLATIDVDLAHGDWPEERRAAQVARFEAERLVDLASPIARAWRRDGIHSRIAASSFYRWLASELWPGDVTDKELLEFAMARGT